MGNACCQLADGRHLLCLYNLLLKQLLACYILCYAEYLNYLPLIASKRRDAEGSVFYPAMFIYYLYLIGLPYPFCNCLFKPVALMPV